MSASLVVSICLTSCVVGVRVCVNVCVCGKSSTKKTQCLCKLRRRGGLDSHTTKASADKNKSIMEGEGEGNDSKEEEEARERRERGRRGVTNPSTHIPSGSKLPAFNMGGKPLCVLVVCPPCVL